MIARTPGVDAGQEGGRETRFGDYVLIDRLGSGGSGAVYRAFQLSLQRLVAVKLISDRADQIGKPDPTEVERFVRESRMAARLSHPHIVPIHEVGEHEGRRYLAMKLIEGQALARTCLSPRRAALVMRQVVSAIAYAHEKGVVHRDLKPHNLLLDRGDHVWVTDFGIARSTKGGSTLTATGSVMGTPAYMPPEQARGQRCDERSDVYSLGATLYELCTGQPPFEGTSDLLVLMSRVLAGDPVPPRRLNPKLPPELETIIGKAMAREPRDRYQSAAALGDDLGRFLDDQPIHARPPGPLPTALKWVKRRPVASMAVACLAALGAAAVLHTRRLERQLAETTVAEANALGAAGEWEAARARYADAARSFARLGEDNAAPALGLLDAYHHAPPPLLVLRGHGAAVRSLAFLPDGERALSASDDGSLRLWNVPLGREIRVLSGHRAAVTSVALGPGEIAISGSEDGTVRLWDLARGRELRVLAARGGGVLKVALSSDGAHALSRTQSGIVQLWQLATGRELRALEVAERRLVAVAFSPDGRLAVTGRNIEQAGNIINARASIWEVATGRELSTLGGFGAEIESIAFSPDGQHILTAGYDRVASVWDRETGRRLLLMRGHRHGLTGAAFSPRDRIIVSAGQDHAVKLWDASDGKLVRSFDTGEPALALAVSPDGKLILTGGQSSAIKLWDLTVGQETRTFSGHEGSVLAVALSPDGRLALSGGNDRKMHLWDVATGRELRAYDQGASVHAVAFSPDGTTAVAVGGGVRVKAWDLLTGQIRPAYAGHARTVRAVAFSPDGSKLLTGDEAGEVVLSDAASGRRLFSLRTGDEVRGVAFSGDGRLAVAASFDGSARLFSVPEGETRRVFRPAPVERIGAIDLSRDGRLLALGDDSAGVQIWDAESGALLHSLAGHAGDVRALRFSPDARLLYSASRDRSLRAWDTRTGRSLHAFTSASDAIRSLALDHAGRLALVGSEDGSMKLWDFSLSEAQGGFEARVSAARATIAIRPGDGGALATLAQWYAFRGVAGFAIELARRAEAASEEPSPLMLARAHWREGDFRAARRELDRALDRGEVPVTYVRLVQSGMGQGQVGRLAQLNSKDGRVRFPFLGLRVRDPGPREPADPLAAGPIVTRVFPGSPAAAAGLRRGDVILRADEELIDGDAKLAGYLASRSAGAVVQLGFARGAGRHSTSAILTERPAQLWLPDAPELREPTGGHTLQTLTTTLAIAFGLDPDTQGAVVTGAATTPVATSRLQVGDVLVKIGGRPIATAEQAAAALAALPAARWDRIDLLRPGQPR